MPMAMLVMHAGGNAIGIGHGKVNELCAVSIFVDVHDHVMTHVNENRHLLSIALATNIIDIESL